MIMGHGMVLTNKLRINLKARDWCRLPYPDHPHGCPNYGKKDVCPPTAPLITDFIDVSDQVGLVYVRFDLEAWAAKMKKRHMNWSERQCRNLLYWQGAVNAYLYTKLLSFTPIDRIYTMCPEAMGVNIISTLKRAGVPIELKPKKYVHKVALFGFPKEVQNG